MLKNNSLIRIAAVSAIVLGFSNGALAASTDVGATLNAQQAITLSNVVNMNFGNVEFAAVHAGNIRLATNGAVTVVGGVGLAFTGTPVAGSVDISSDGVSPMEISCETGGTLASGANTLTLAATEIVAGAGVAAGAGTACAGVGTTPLVSTTATTVRIGGSINVAGNALHNGAYSTANAGGNPVTIDVVYQ